MKYLLALAILLAAAWGTGRADTLSQEAFTRELARALTTALPSSTVTVTGHLQIAVKDASGRDLTLVLTRTYEDYAAGARFEVVVKAVVERLSQPAKAAATVDRSRIVPVIKHRA